VDNWYAQAPYSNDLPVFQELEKRTGIKVKWEALPDDQYWKTINTRIAANTDLADLVEGGDEASLLAKQGIARPIDDLIEQYGPNIKKAMEEHPALKKSMVSSDGHIYKVHQVIPGMIFANPFSPLLIRKDWIDELGLTIPTNPDELYTVLKAFKEKDPNGNGQADEIPMTVEYGGGAALSAFGTLFGVDMNWMEHAVGTYTLNEDRTKVILNLDRPEVKEFVATMAKWYTEGLIDKEATKSNTDVMLQKLSSNTAGAAPGFFSNGTVWANAAKQSGDPNAEFYGLLPFNNGKMTYSSGIGHQYWIPTSSKNAEAVIKWVDFLYSKEGTLLTYYGIEGLTYTMGNDGVPHFTDFVNKNPENLTKMQALWSVGVGANIPRIIPVPTMTSTYIDPAAYTESDPVVSEALKRLEGRWEEGFPTLSFTQEELNELDKTIFNDCDAYYNENMAKFFSGQLPMSEWDGFVEKIKKMGLSRQTEIWQAALDRYNAQ
jgi:putative aldouronate transport system substrate-binding protein